MTDDTTTNDTRTGTKTVKVYGWAELNPTATIVQPADRKPEEIPNDDKINALKETVKQRGYDPEKFHITTDYIEEITRQDTLTNTVQYKVLGWCEYGPSGTITVDEDTAVDDIPNETLRETLSEDLREHDIDPSELAIEIDEVHVDV